MFAKTSCRSNPRPTTSVSTVSGRALKDEQRRRIVFVTVFNGSGSASRTGNVTRCVAIRSAITVRMDGSSRRRTSTTSSRYMRRRTWRTLKQTARHCARCVTGASRAWNEEGNGRNICLTRSPYRQRSADMDYDGIRRVGSGRVGSGRGEHRDVGTTYHRVAKRARASAGFGMGGLT